MVGGQALPPFGFRLQAGEEEAVRWWVRPRAYGVVMIRSSHTPGLQPLPFLFPPEIVETGWEQRIWQTGVLCKPPFLCSHPYSKSSPPGFPPLPFLFPPEIIETGREQRIWLTGVLCCTSPNLCVVPHLQELTLCQSTQNL